TEAWRNGVSSLLKKSHMVLREHHIASPLLRFSVVYRVLRTFRGLRGLVIGLAVVTFPLIGQAQRRESRKPFTVVEASISDLRVAMESGRMTSRQIVTAYLARIAMYEDLLHAAIAVNRHALDEADRLDRERRAGRVRGPLHGIPIALKDNIHTTDLPTTGGAL